MNAPLAGCRVLHTRADRHWPQARNTLKQLGASPLHLPLMDTRAIPFQTPQALDAALFTSANAVEHFLAHSALPCAAVAIGAKTAQTLIRHNHPPTVTAPPPYDSEALLSVWQPHGQHIAIIAAHGGRQILAEALAAHNRVNIVYAYERFCPATRCIFTETNLPHATLIASQRTLDHLLKIAEPNTLKLLQWRTCIVALSPRIARYATDLGFRQTASAASADETAQLHALAEWWKNNKELRHE